MRGTIHGNKVKLLEICAALLVVILTCGFAVGYYRQNHARYVFYLSQGSVKDLNPVAEYHAVQKNSKVFTFDALPASVGVNSATLVDQANAIAGYVNTSSKRVNAVGVYSQCRLLGAGTHCWGSNQVFSDGGFGGTGTAAEFDSNVSNVDTQGEGVQITGSFSLEPKSFPALVVDKPGSGRWSTALQLQNGASSNALDVGAQGTQKEQYSMTINLHGTDSSGLDRFAYLQVNPNGSFLISPASEQGVGIGTKDPQATLDVEGTAKVSKSLSVGGGRPIVDSSDLVRQLGVVITRAEVIDNFTIPGITMSSHCFLQPTNKIAAGLEEVYVSAVGNGSISVAHPPTAGASFNVACALK